MGVAVLTLAGTTSAGVGALSAADPVAPGAGSSKLGNVSGGVHYYGHPSSRTIGHWIVGHGYYSGGDSSRFTDPSTTARSGVNEHFTYDTSNFVNRFLQANGITW